MAKVLFYKNKLEEILDLRLKVLDICKKTLGEKHRTGTDAYNKLAQTYSSLPVRLESKGKYDEALAILEHELAIRQQMSTENDNSDLDQLLALKIAYAYQNISLVMEKQGKLKESLQVLEKCLDIRRESLNEQHYTVIRGTKQKK
jgi:tetratricopeptide (TPR) repeat protein